MKGIPVRWVMLVWILAAVGAGPVENLGGAEAGLVLKPRLIVGSECVTGTRSEMTMNLPSGEASGEQRVEMEEEHRMSVSESGNGQKLVQIEITSVRVDMQMPGMAVRYDSRDPATRDAPFGEPFRKLINNPVQMVYDGDDKFVKMASTDAFSGRGNSPFGQEIGAEQMKEMIRSSFADGFPEEAVGLGDSWTYTMAVPVAGMGKMDFDLKFVYTKDAQIDGTDCAVVGVSGAIRAQSAGDPGKDDPGKDEAGREEAIERRADEGIESSRLSGTFAVEKGNRVIRESDTTMEVTLRMPSPLGGEEILVPVKHQTRSTVLSFHQRGE